jgi:hypothetical protein
MRKSNLTIKINNENVDNENLIFVKVGSKLLRIKDKVTYKCTVGKNYFNEGNKIKAIMYLEDGTEIDVSGKDVFIDKDGRYTIIDNN